MPNPIIPPIADDGDADPVRLRKSIMAIRDVLNHLIRRNTIIRDNTSDRWKLGLVDADIPASIARDSEVTAAINAITFPVVATFLLGVGSDVATGTTLTTTVIVPLAGTIVKAWAKAQTGPVGADLIFDINLNGTTIWSTQANRLKIVDGATSGNQTAFNTTSVAAGDLLTIDIDQIGSTTPGKNVTVELTMYLIKP